MIGDKNSGDYSITRICLPECETSDEGLEFRDCCSHDRCNGAISSSVTSRAVNILVALCVIALLLNARVS